MKGGDLSNRPTSRYLVISDVVFVRDETRVVRKPSWRNWFSTKRVEFTPNLHALSELWRFSNIYGVRLELVFVGDDAKEATRLWDELLHVTNPFSDWIGAEDFSSITGNIPVRPDILGYIDLPQRTLLYGGKGLSLESLR